MIRNYFTTAIRNLLKHKSHTIVNMAGLAVGFAAFIIISMVIYYQKSFDNFHPKKNAIYRVVRIGKNPVNREYRTGVPFPVTQALREELPQLTNAAAILADNDVQVNIQAPDGSLVRKFKESNGVFIAEPQFFQMFNFSVAEGSAGKNFSEPNTLLLTKSAAAKYFGDWKNVTGKTLNVDGINVKVIGILNDPPANSDFPLKLVLSYSSLQPFVKMDNWENITDNNYCFVQLSRDPAQTGMEQLLAAFTKKHITPVNTGYGLSLQPLGEMHYDERYGNFSGQTFSKDLILALTIISTFLLVIACVNFINLTTAQAFNRAREVGVRKVLGSQRLQLIWQFLGETGIISLLALICSLIFVVMGIPYVNNLLEISLNTDMLFSTTSILFMTGILLMVTFLSGFYPALVLSGFKAAHVLKAAFKPDQRKGIYFRRGLVVFQFVIAQALIIGTLVVVSQMDYFRNADMGFRKEAIVNAGFPNDSLSRTKLSYFTSELLKTPGIQDISYSSFPPSGGGGWFTDLRTHPGSKEPDMIVNMKPADTSYFRVYAMPIVAGRVYYASDTIREFVVNEAVVRNLGLTDPKQAIGKRIEVNGRICPIVGVVKDYHVNSLRDPIQAVVMTTMKRQYGMVNIKIDMKQAKSVVTAMEKIWNRDYPDFMFEYHFLDQSIADYYKQENQLSQLYQLFSGIAIFISCLGLYGLISFMAVQRKKEIGIRKVLGAPVRDIMIMLSREFTMLIILAFLIASPLAWYFMHQWLQHYTYRINMGVWFFAATILGCICIAWITVGYTAIRAAVANPVESLRTE